MTRSLGASLFLGFALSLSLILVPDLQSPARAADGDEVVSALASDTSNEETRSAREQQLAAEVAPLRADKLNYVRPKAASRHRHHIHRRVAPRIAPLDRQAALHIEPRPLAARIVLFLGVGF
jgi:hypothetical protein